MIIFNCTQYKKKLKKCFYSNIDQFLNLVDTFGDLVLFNNPQDLNLLKSVIEFFFLFNCDQMLAEIEDHLNITIAQVDQNMQVPVNEFDGKVVYGEKLLNKGSNYQDHVEQLKPVVQNLAKLEAKAQLLFLKHMKTH